jgi:two-component system LytT family response regulator
MLKAIIIDDEKASIDSLTWELELFADKIEIIGSSTSPQEAISMVESLQPDVIFLDVNMPKLNGFQFLKHFPNFTFEVIFTTAYDEYAIKAFEINAIDYLLKPVDSDDLTRAISRLEKTKNPLNEKLELLLATISSFDKGNKKIAIPISEGYEFLNIGDIIRCESDSNYTRIILKEDKPLLVSKTLKNIEEQIDSTQFIRIHNSHLINVAFIKKYKKGKGGSITMINGDVVPVSRAKKNEFFEGI